MPASCPAPAALAALLDGSVESAQQAELTGHLETCSSCQQVLQELAGGPRSWADAAESLARDTQQDSDALRELICQLKARSEWTQRPPPGRRSGRPSFFDFLDRPKQTGNLGRLKHYEILEEIGRGGMGVVFKAFDEVLHRVVAIKVLLPNLATAPRARERFIREAQSAAAINHENVVTIYGVGEHNGVPYIVMQMVVGTTLQRKIDRAGAFDLRDIVRIGLQIAEGLAAAHELGLVHRDVKPGNILLEDGVQRVKITDFGLARALDDVSIAQTGVISGTPMYMAPEQARGDDNIDQRADLFSLGSVLYAMCTGKPPFRAGDVQSVLKSVASQTPRPMRELTDHIPEWLETLVASLHAKRVNDRISSAFDVAEILREQMARMQSPRRTVTGRGRKSTAGGERRSRWSAALLLMFVFLAGTAVGATGFAVWSWAYPPPPRPDEDRPAVDNEVPRFGPKGWWAPKGKKPPPPE